MNIENAFITAAKSKLRFQTGGGHLSVEELFDLSLKSLDMIAVAIDAKLSGSGGHKTFLESPDRKMLAERTQDELRLELLKAIIAIKQDENKARRAESEKAARRAFLSKLLDKKRINALESLSQEEIEAQLQALDAEDPIGEEVA